MLKAAITATKAIAVIIIKNNLANFIQQEMQESNEFIHKMNAAALCA